MLRRAGFFGRMLSLRLEFGYWVFEGDLQPIQRPSWNYRAEDGGGMILDMMCHWRYVLDNLFGEVSPYRAWAPPHIPRRWDRGRQPYRRPPTTPPRHLRTGQGHTASHGRSPQIEHVWSRACTRRPQ
jgi:hypothetical protein